MRVFGAAIALLSVPIAVIPQFNNCLHEDKVLTLANGRTVPMKCYWTAQAEIAVAVPLLALGIMLALSHRREIIRALSGLGVILGAFVILLPTQLIGVCSTMTASCNQVMQPSMILLGTLVVASSLAALLLSERRSATLSISRTGPEPAQ